MREARFDFTGECYAVTGASSGMGRAVALALAKSGARVLAIARREDRLKELAAAAPAGAVTPAALDVTDAQALEQALAGFTASQGKLSGSVHAAGILVPTPLNAYNPRKAQKMMEVTFWAGMQLLQLACRSQYAGEGTSHVLFSSADAWCCEKGKFAYAAAKAAVNAGVRAAAKEVGAQGHRVNAVLPGWVATEMTESPLVQALTNHAAVAHKAVLGQGEPGDVTGLVLFLLSDAAAWLTGACLPIDGGYTA